MEQSVITRVGSGARSHMVSSSGSLRRLDHNNKAGRGDGMSLPDAPHIFLAAALSPPPNSFFEFSGRRRSKAKGQLLPAGNSWPALHPPSRWHCSSCAAATS